MRKVVIGGIYQHFKGGKYKVLFEALNSESKEKMIIYKNLESGQIWVRPSKMFLEIIERDGKKFERFSQLKST